jgi:Tat protein secretion system quality control protein TatD with DNase activity
MIDCHAHLANEDFDAGRDAVRYRAAAAGVSAVLVVGEDGDDNARVLRVIAEASSGGAWMLPCLGLHPDRFADDRRCRPGSSWTRPSPRSGSVRVGLWPSVRWGWITGKRRIRSGAANSVPF